jgi:glycosyltransferase involved in cell wall biosynthesis
MGGIETHVHEVSRRLVERDCDVSVLTTDLSRELDAVDVTDGGVLVRRFDAWPRSKDYYVSPPLLWALASGSYDVIHVQGAHTALAPLALALANQRGLPALVTFHTGGSSSPLRSRARSAQWTVEAPLLRRAAARVAVCTFEVELFSRLLHLEPGAFTVIRNGCEPLPTSGEPPHVTGSPLILSIGRLEEYKGHHRALRAMSEVRRRSPSARLVIVGHGPYEPELKALTARLGLDDAVGFASFAPSERAELGDLVRRSDAVVLLSDYEANPVAVMEALGLGTNVLVARTSGLTELVDGGLATAVDVDASPTDVAVAMLGATADTRWSSGPPDLPSWDGCADRLADLYESVIEDGGQVRRRSA